MQIHTSHPRYDTIKGKYKKGRWHYISLYNSDVTKFHLDYFHFRLLLLDGNHHILPDDEAKALYSSLLKNFKDRGQDDSYRMLDIEYQDFKWDHNKYFFWFGWFLHNWNYYGHRPELPLLYTVCFIILFTIITFLCLPFLHNNVYRIDVITNQTLTGREESSQVDELLSYQHFGKRAWYSFIYTSLIFFPLSLKVDKIKVDKKLGTLYLMLMYISGLVCVAYVANFILQK